MNTRAVLLSVGLLLASFSAGEAQNITLPLEDFSDAPVSANECKRPTITFEKDRIIHRIDQEGVRGEARCKILKTKRQAKGIIWINKKCDWDKHVPQYMRESLDNEDDDAYSLKVQSFSKILLNNIDYERCPSASGAGR